MNTSGTHEVADCDVKIYHYSRIGDPEAISKRILALDKLFHNKDKLLDEAELEPYNFSMHNFDCMHKESVDVGRTEAKEGELKAYKGSHPSSFKDYNGT